METKNGFTLMDSTEFIAWLPKQIISRKIIAVQQHHTWSPGYRHFNGSNHFSLSSSMRDFHLERGFSDIAQHFTTFPDGKICTGRSLNQIPAGIKGANTGAICIENLGNFDNGGDSMKPEHRDSIISVTATLLKYLGLNADTSGILYHHWYDLTTGLRTNGTGNTKSCPGTDFFDGNSVQNCQNNFIPSVLAKMDSTIIKSGSEGKQILNAGRVIADKLNVRNGPSSEYKIVDALYRGVEVNCYKAQGSWWKIHPTKSQWANKNYIIS